MKKLPLRLILCVALIFLGFHMSAQTSADYEALVQTGNAQLQAGHADLALTSGEQAIKSDGARWEGYALAGGALMNLRQYEKAADMFSHAIDRAPEAKQATLRDLRKQSLLAEAGASTAAVAPPQTATTTQAEIVLWKSIENSTNPADFRGYLTQYPNGAFVVLANQHLAVLQAQAKKERERRDAAAELEDDRQTVESRFGLSLARIEGVPGIGVMEVKRGSFADSIGLQAGMVVLEINKQKIVLEDDCFRQLVRLKSGDDLVFMAQIWNSKKARREPLGANAVFLAGRVP